MSKRVVDIFFSTLGIIILSPLYLMISIAIKLDDGGPVLFKQVRVGKKEKQFEILKFRTMKLDAEKYGQLTVGGKDPRITKVGYFLRKYKLDELTQLFNVLNGTMSFVGPRPEVPKYTAMYNEEQKKVFDVKPGITDMASLAYFEENDLLAKAQDPEACYINEVMPAKLKLNLDYVANNNLLTDFRIIFLTIKKIVS